MIRVTGIDPSVSSVAWASVFHGEDGSLILYECGFVHIDYFPGVSRVRSVSDAVEGLNCADSVYVEGQHVDPKRTRFNAADIIALAQTAGMIASRVLFRCSHVEIVTAHQWKGELTKKVSQSHAWDLLGVPYTVTKGKVPYCVPDVEYLKDVHRCRIRMPPGSSHGKWKDIGDAVGIALSRGKTAWLRSQPQPRSHPSSNS
jgi:hypothetical protein